MRPDKQVLWMVALMAGLGLLTLYGGGIWSGIWGLVLALRLLSELLPGHRPQRIAQLLPDDLRQQLVMVEPSVDGTTRFYPCRVRRKSGRVMERVYFTENDWDALARDLWVGDIGSIEVSPGRLPVRFANELYAAGESGMGYRVFVIEFRDGTRQAYQTGGWVDFLEYPDGKGPEDVVRVLPHEGRSKWLHLGHHQDFAVCLSNPIPSL